MTTITYPSLNGPKFIGEIRALRALGRDVVKTPLHWLCLDLALDAYQALVNDRRMIGILATGERIAIGDLITSEKPEHTTPRADLIVVSAERLGVPAALLALVVTRVLSIKAAQADGSLTRYRAVMKARALDDVQFGYDEEDGYGALDVWSRKARIATANAEHAARAAAPTVMPVVMPTPTRKAEPTGFARVLGMFR